MHSQPIRDADPAPSHNRPQPEGHDVSGGHKRIDMNPIECPSPVLRPSRSSSEGARTIPGNNSRLTSSAESELLLPTPAIPVLHLPKPIGISPSSPVPGPSEGDDGPKSPSALEIDTEPDPVTDTDTCPLVIPTLALTRNSTLLRAKNISISGSVSISGRCIPMLNGQEIPLDSIPNSLRDLQSLSNSVASSTLRPKKNVLEYLSSIGNTTLRPPVGRLTTGPIALRTSRSGSLTVMPGDGDGDGNDIAKRRQMREDEVAEREDREAEMSFNSRMRQFERDLRAQTTEGKSSSGEEDGIGMQSRVRDGRVNVIVPKRIRKGDSVNIDGPPDMTIDNVGRTRVTPGAGADADAGIATGGAIDEVEVEWCFFCGEEKARSQMELKQVSLQQRKTMRARALDPLLDEDDAIGSDCDSAEAGTSVGDNEKQDNAHRRTARGDREKTWQWVCKDGCGLDRLHLGKPFNAVDPDLVQDEDF
ncbi:hypothetical protein IAT40_003597 [Kwoniella sp. CBS 6097]